MARVAGQTPYHADFLAWAEEQAARLRALGRDNRIDAENLAEEIAALGKSHQHALASHVRLALQHLVQLAAAPTAEPATHWADEVDTHRAEIAQLLETSPSLRRRVDLNTLWRRAVRDANRKLARHGDPTVEAGAACPITLDVLAADDQEMDAVLSAVADGCLIRPS